MDTTILHIRAIMFLLSCMFLPLFAQILPVPVAVPDRHSIQGLQLTPIGAFRAYRPDRPGIPAHLHTGIDIRRPTPNYLDEPIFPIASGRVISVREDGPFAQIIIEHYFPEWGQIWSVYEHVAGILCTPGDSVHPAMPIARFMNRHELQQYGYQFDHVHLEVLKRPPKPVYPTPELPRHYFTSYSLICYNDQQLLYYYINPIQLFARLDHSQQPQRDQERALQNLSQKHNPLFLSEGENE